MSQPSSLGEATPRLIAEFLVIVIGVLVALGADQWAEDREARVLEAEYLAAAHDPSSNAYKSLSKGIRPGVTRFINETCAKKDMDLGYYAGLDLDATG